MCSHDDATRLQGVTVRVYVAVAPPEASRKHKVVLGEEAVYVLKGYQEEIENENLRNALRARAADLDLYDKPPETPENPYNAVIKGDDQGDSITVQDDLQVLGIPGQAAALGLGATTPAAPKKRKPLVATAQSARVCNEGTNYTALRPWTATYVYASGDELAERKPLLITDVNKIPGASPLIDRDLLLSGEAKLRIFAGPHHLLTLQKMDGSDNLGLVAAMDLKDCDIVTQYLGPRMAQVGAEDTNRQGNAMALDTTDETKKVVPGRNESWLFAHFINASDWPKGKESTPRSNVVVRGETATWWWREAVVTGQELLLRYGKAYYKKDARKKGRKKPAAASILDKNTEPLFWAISGNPSAHILTMVRILEDKEKQLPKGSIHAG